MLIIFFSSNIDKILCICIISLSDLEILNGEIIDEFTLKFRTQPIYTKHIV